MGCEVNVPLDFDWPQGEVWWGFRQPVVNCLSCKGSGKRPNGQAMGSSGEDTECCDVCEGIGSLRPKIPVPKGDGWQMWETVSEGSPISPVFATTEGLARWLAENKATTLCNWTPTYDQWMRTIKGGWAPSFVVDDQGLRSGVEFMAEQAERKSEA